jgi:hypothetical protein
MNKRHTVADKENTMELFDTTQPNEKQPRSITLGPHDIGAIAFDQISRYYGLSEEQRKQFALMIANKRPSIELFDRGLLGAWETWNVLFLRIIDPSFIADLRRQLGLIYGISTWPWRKNHSVP